GWAFATGEQQLERSLHSIGRDVGEISRILVTHVHRDHYTQAVSIRERYGARVGLGENERPNLAEIQASITRKRAPGNFEVLVRAGAAVLLAEIELMSTQDGQVWTDPDEWLTGGQVVAVGGRSLRAISTPGHTAGHLVFRDDDNALLFAGDHVLPHITPSIGFEPAAVRWPLRDYLDSLALMKSEPDARLLPAHGPVTASVHARVDELLAHHAKRLDDSRSVVERGATTSYQTALKLSWTRRGRAFDDLDRFNQCLAVLETAAHLDVLVLQGRMTSTLVEGIERYVVT
ncbi:MAG: MBL fold metallo-hydrolase, partial [Janthinobacterium lividum]